VEFFESVGYCHIEAKRPFLTFADKATTCPLLLNYLKRFGFAEPLQLSLLTSIFLAKTRE
jgi:hypothetical protein